jgi:hypothetical protein
MTDIVNPPCRLCGEPLTQTFVDLGMSPPCESYLRPDEDDNAESFYPLHVRTCTECLLVQLPAYVSGEHVFSDYLYFSSFSTSWVEHAGRFVADMVDRIGLGPESFVVEVASNDGYLLKHAVARGIPVLGIEPASNIAEVAREAGVPTENVFLGERTGKEIADRYGRADLVVGNNVYAHVPDLRDFSLGLRALVADDGLVSLEFPHLLQLMTNRQFDTIYHEHYQYYTLKTATRALAQADLVVVDVEELRSHGGSLRVFAKPSISAGVPSAAVEKVLADEAALGLHTVEGHDGFAAEVFQIKRDLLRFLLDAKAEGKTVAGYGAPGKGNTLLNHCGIRADLLPYTTDRSTYKHNMLLPGTHIPILAPEVLTERKPDYILILPWNLREEIANQLSYAREWGAKFVVPIPALTIF